MPEGDSLHRAAQSLQVLVGQPVEVETPNPRANGKRLVERLNGLRLESVEAVGKNLLLRFEGGLVLRSHLRMTGRWRVEPRGAKRTGRPWLVLRGAEYEAVLWNGPVLELGRGSAPVGRLGPDILAEPPDFESMLERLRAAEPGVRSARRSSTSGSSPGSGTSGAPSRSGTSGSRRGGRSPTCATASCSRCSTPRTA